jgi:glc operon protein GlcG
MRRTLSSAALAFAIATMPSAAGAQGSPGMTLSEALQIIDTAQKEAASKNYRLSFAVVDARGDLIAVVRMPGAGAATPDTAIGKAMLSAFYGQPSAALTQRSTNAITQALNESTGGRFRFFQGALPVVRGGITVGAVAASGATAQQDEDVVKTALAAVQLR